MVRNLKELSDVQDFTQGVSDKHTQRKAFSILTLVTGHLYLMYSVCSLKDVNIFTENFPQKMVVIV